MSEDQVDFGRAHVLGAEAIGEPGNRRFRIYIRSQRGSASLWLEREQRDEYFGTLTNAWLARGGCAVAVRAGESYVDVGTLHGYRQAIKILGRADQKPQAQPEIIFA